MAAGFRLAKGSALVTLDGDLQNDPAEIPRLVEMLRIGTRCAAFAFVARMARGSA